MTDSANGSPGSSHDSTPLIRREIAVADLCLDPANPRLPEQLHDADQVTLLKYLNDETVLDELIRSFNDNGFFPHEPLIAYEDEELGWVALEGNRRLAALKVITGTEEARDLGLEPSLETAPTASRLQELATVPAYIVADRDDVHRYLGFRHIGGIKTWSAESKARYLMREADRIAGQAAENPFLEVARRVGSNSQGVRNAYTAIAILRHARDEYSLEVSYVLHNRFGVWSRCMTAPDVRHYIGLDGGRTYHDVKRDVESVERDQLREVLGDLTPAEGRRPVLYDSRDVTVYGQILKLDVARNAMRRHRDLDVARHIVELAALPDRIRNLGERIDVARDEAQQAEFTRELGEAGDSVWRSARALRATIGALRFDDEDEAEG